MELVVLYYLFKLAISIASADTTIECEVAQQGLWSGDLFCFPMLIRGNSNLKLV